MKIASSEDYEGIDIWYPNLEGQRKEIQIDMISVRACGHLMVSYDFARDGWVIKMQPYTEHGIELEEEGEPEEVAFLPAFHEVEAKP